MSPSLPSFWNTYRGLCREVLPIRRAVLAVLEQTTQLGRRAQGKDIRGDEMPQRARPETGACLGPRGLTAHP